MQTVRIAMLIGMTALFVSAPFVHAQVDAARGPATAPAAGRGGGRGPAAPLDVSAENIQTLAGFKVEVVLKADPVTHGSWISMTKDSKGRLLLAGQAGQPLTRLTVDGATIVKEEVLKLPVTEIMGMVEVGDALYINGRGPGANVNAAAGATTQGGDGRGNANNVYGLYRFKDPERDGSFRSVEFLREWPRGSGEHGAHALVLSPDKKYIYSQNGNGVPQPTDIDPKSPVRNYADDRAIPRQEDTFMANEKPPGGSIIRMDLEGKNPVVVAAGERNTYDMAFNADGEIFGFDSDMEWDWGLPWYRPTFAFHAVAGADHGYRGGSGKYPTYYEDILPPILNVGLGSPTGVVFGYGAKFPAKYQRAFFIQDWTFGRIIAVHLTPRGASYEATWENLIAPKSLYAARKVPLQVTDMEIGTDGAMYFTIGGRNTQSCLYRVSYTGAESTAPADLHDKDGAEARALRHKLEALNGREDATAVATAWPHLGSNDRYIRFAARLAIESQPVSQWKAKALSEANPQAAIEALIALARVGGAEAAADVYNGLAKWPLLSLSEDLQLQKLRCLEIAISRNGKPTIDQAEKVIAEVDTLYPSYSTRLNNELSQILLALNAPGALSKTIKLLQAADTVEEQMAYLMYMRQIKVGWTPELRRDYFSWFNADHSGAKHPDDLIRWFREAGRPYSNGSSYNGYVSRTRNEAFATLTPEEKESGELAPVLAAYRPPAGRGGRGARGATTAPETPGGRGTPATAPIAVRENDASRVAAALAAPAPAKPVVRVWTMADLEPSLPLISSGRNFQRGQAAYAAQCATCHALGDVPALGGIESPDLTSIAARFRRRDILESIIEPSTVISEQFADQTVRLKNGNVVSGHIIEDGNDKLVIQTNPQTYDKTEVKKSDIATQTFSKVSPMPAGLVNTLSKDEILDLIAYMEAGGRRDHPNFAK